MTIADLQALTPFIILTVTVVAQLLLASTSRAHGPTATVGAVGSLAAGAAALLGPGAQDATPVGALVTLDPIGVVMLAVSTTSAAAASALAWQRAEALRARDPSVAEPVELQMLLVIAAFGASLLAVASHAATVLLGVEIAAVAYTGAVAWRRDDGLSIEAGAKALVMGAVASAFLLYGVALAWAEVGSLSLAELGGAGPLPAMLILVGLAIKLGAAPVHGWVADSWQGASAPVALLLGTTAKAGLLAAALHLWPQGAAHTGGWLLVLAMVSMVGGALLGLSQRRVKRMLAASSIAHMGDLLLGVAVGGVAAQRAVAMYAAGYALTLVAVFAVLETLADAEERDTLDALAGGGRRHPAAAVLLTLGLASLAGIPFTAGFAGKLALVQAAASAGLWGPLAVLAVGTVITGAMYLRLLAAVWQGDAAASEVDPRRPLVLAVLAGCVLIALGARPDLIAVPLWAMLS